jgi:hypothetical protein
MLSKPWIKTSRYDCDRNTEQIFVVHHLFRCSTQIDTQDFVELDDFWFPVTFRRGLDPFPQTQVIVDFVSVLR